MSVSVVNGRCGPCCSNEPVGRITTSLSKSSDFTTGQVRSFKEHDWKLATEDTEIIEKIQAERCDLNIILRACFIVMKTTSVFSVFSVAKYFVSSAEKIEPQKEAVNR